MNHICPRITRLSVGRPNGSNGATVDNLRSQDGVEDGEHEHTLTAWVGASFTLDMIEHKIASQVKREGHLVVKAWTARLGAICGPCRLHFGDFAVFTYASHTDSIESSGKLRPMPFSIEPSSSAITEDT